MLTDTFNRRHNYLRISLTDKCNFRCFYCMPDEDHVFTPAAQLMQAHEIEAIATTFVNLGVTKIRLTGGEPLVHRDAAHIIRSLAKLPVTLTLTTNGTRLHEFESLLKESNISSVNISLDTLDAQKFQLITRRNQFNTVRDNIDALVLHGFHVKVNVVVMKGINDTEIADFVAWTRDTPVHVRFIEFMPFTGNRWMSEKVVSLQAILETICQQYSYLPLKGEKNDTAKGYIVPGHAGTFAVISTMTSPFCSTCNRMRLTADGKLKNCLFSKEETDLLTAFRNGENLEPLIIQSIKNKEAERGGQFVDDMAQLQSEAIQNRSMISIGG